MLNKLCVVICSHQRQILLQKTLDYLNQAQRPLLELQICVVANACSDGTQQMLERYHQDHPGSIKLIWLDEPRAGKSIALNLALAHLPDWHIALVDDDHRVDSQYLVQIEQALLAWPNADLICGRIVPDWDGSEPNWVHLKSDYAIYPLPIPDYSLGAKPLVLANQHRLPGGGNLVLRQGLFAKVGGFSEDLGPTGHNLCGGEDGEFVSRVMAHQGIIQYTPEIVQFHYVDPERLRLTYLLSKAFQRSCSVVMLSSPLSSPIPKYLWRKLLSYLFHILFSLHWPKTRFYMMRCAAVAGEMCGYYRQRRE
ncbi:glycosyltransferase family 2 protein [Motilimonas sp. E26]|uniref:glycosyltransferase n=1 Tax=Motilimonas sp. E26 TaxID=2865674 RepID=UPI001E5A0E88|nr:glycosyltransferase family 2 protein [Motilimonas sp. E26]MCE0556603.1 glycosyltransferase [Motilimonas sp. E26]